MRERYYGNFRGIRGSRDEKKTMKMKKKFFA